MKIKSFTTQILCSIVLLTLSTSGWSMEVLPPPSVPLSLETGSPPSAVIEAAASPSLPDIQPMANGYAVESGNISISMPKPHELEVNMGGSSTGIVNWSTFNVGPNDTVRFINPAPTGQSILLNRIDSTNGPSHILGHVEGPKNLNLIFSNPAGINFEPTSTVNVHSILATTAQITTDAFNQGVSTGRYIFTKGSLEGVIHNQGKIEISEGGFAALIGNKVNNEGLIRAKFGTVIIGGATAYVLDFEGDRLINFEITPEPGKNLSQDTTSRVTHTGSLINEGGLVLITTKEARQFVLKEGILQKNIPQATSAEQEGGIIVLKGEVSVNGPKGGDIRAETGEHLLIKDANLSANGEGEKGGTIKILGPHIATDTSTVTATGKHGGGKVFMGGGFQGKNPDMENSKTVSIDPNTVIDVSATMTGEGGEGIVWSDGTTHFKGTLRSKGGKESGNGGSLEISGKENLIFNPKKIDTLSPHGNPGHLLLDPKNLTISNAGTDAYINNHTYAQNPGGLAGIDPDDLVGIGDITLQANTDVTITNGFQLNGGNSLSISAGRSIIINDNISTDGGAMTLIANDYLNALGADRDAGAGNIQIAVGTVLTTGGGFLAMNIGTGNTTPFNPGEIMGTGGAGTVTLNGGTGEVSLTGTLSGNTGNESFTIGGANLSFGNVSGVNALSTFGNGPGTITLEGSSVSAGSIDFNRVVTITQDTTISTSGAMTFQNPINDQAVGSHDLTLNSVGVMTLNGIGTGTNLKSLTLQTAPNAIGTEGVPIQISLNNNNTPALFLGTEGGGYFQGTLNGDNTATAVNQARLISGSNGDFYINGVLLRSSSSTSSTSLTISEVERPFQTTRGSQLSDVEKTTKTNFDLVQENANMIRQSLGSSTPATFSSMK